MLVNTVTSELFSDVFKGTSLEIIWKALYKCFYVALNTQLPCFGVKLGVCVLGQDFLEIYSSLLKEGNCALMGALKCITWIGFGTG